TKKNGADGHLEVRFELRGGRRCGFKHRVQTAHHHPPPPPNAHPPPPAARHRVLTEPVGRNTAAAIALASIHVRHTVQGDALLAVLPADHYIALPENYREIVRAALQLAREPERMVVLGIPPTRPDTGFGYIEKMGEPLQVDGYAVYAVRRFTEKPQLEM